jgi:hypothetical protein
LRFHTIADMRSRPTAAGASLKNRFRFGVDLRAPIAPKARNSRTGLSSDNRSRSSGRSAHPMLSGPLADRGQSPRGEEPVWSRRRPGAQCFERAPTARFCRSSLCIDVAGRPTSLWRCTWRPLRPIAPVAKRRPATFMPGYCQPIEARNGTATRQAAQFRLPLKGHRCCYLSGRSVIPAYEWPNPSLN